MLEFVFEWLVERPGERGGGDHQGHPDEQQRAQAVLQVQQPLRIHQQGLCEKNEEGN